MRFFEKGIKGIGIKRIIAVLMAFVMLISCALMSTAAAAKTTAISPAKALLEAMLSGDRYWVLETLVGDNYANNPQAKANFLSNSESMMKETLDNYNNADGTAYGAIYKAMVDILEKKVNADKYVEGFFDSVTELWNDNIIAIFGSGSEFARVADDLSGSLDELQYESILKAALVAEYTSSLGVTLGESESSYANVKQLKKALDSVNSWISYLRAKNEFAVGSAEYQSIEEYVEDYLLPYSDAVTGYLNSVSDMASKPNEFAKRYLTDVAGFMLIMAECEMHKGDDWLNYSFSTDMAKHFADSGFMDVLKGAGKTLELGSLAIDNYIYLNMIQSQKETLTGPLNRISANTSDADLAKVMTRFSELAAAQADEKMIAYETIRDTLRNENFAGKQATKAVKGMAKKLFKISDDAALLKVFAKISMIINIATWGAEKAVNVETTAKLTYELKYLQRIINECVNQYTRDLTTYNAFKTEENATKVLDDLLLLQRLRLRGETVSYNMSSGQMDSWIGKLLAGQTDLDNFKAQYQKHIDVLIAASVMPATANLLEIGSGQELTLYYDYDNGWSGYYKKGNGENVYFGDVVSYVSNGIVLNGGTLNINNTSGESFSLPCIEATNNSTININGGDLYLYELATEGTVSVNIKNNAVLSLDGQLYDRGTLYFSSAYPVNTVDVDVSGIVTGAMLKITGDSTLASNSVITSADFCGNERQYVKGNSGHIGNLLITNTNAAGVTVENAFYVDNSIYNTTAAVQYGKNIILHSDGQISGSYINNDITLSGITLDKDMHFGGSVFTKGNFATNGSLLIDGSLVDDESNSFSFNFNGSDVTVFGDVNLTNLSIWGLTEIDVHGDLNMLNISGDGNINATVGGNVTGDSTLSTSSITLNGRAPQKISGFTAKNLCINNTKGGVEVQNPVTVNEKIENISGNIKNGKQITLSNGGLLEGEIWRGSLTVNDWTTETPSEITGDLYTKDNCSISGDLTIGGSVIGGSGFTLTGADLEVGKNVYAISSIRADSESDITIGNDLNVYQIYSDATVTVNGDIDTDSSFMHRLVLSGSLRQSITGGGFSADDLVLESTHKDGININSNITVNGTFYKNNVDVYGNSIITASKIVGGKGKLHALNLKNAVINEDTELECDVVMLVGSLTVDGATLRMAGDLQPDSANNQNDITVTESGVISVMGDAILSNERHTLNGVLDFNRDATFDNVTLDGTGLISVAGDASFSNYNLNFGGDLKLDGKLYQNMYGNLTVRDFILDNTDKRGISLDSDITVNGVFYKNNVNVYGEGQVTTGSIVGAKGKIGKLVLNNATLTEDMVIDGNLKIISALTVDDCFVTVNGGITAEGIALNVHETAGLDIMGDTTLSSCTLNLGGKTALGRDVYLKYSSVNGSGSIALTGDLRLDGGSFNYGGDLKLCGKTPQTVYSNSPIISVKRLEALNPSREGITFKSGVRYSDEFIKNTTVIKGEENVLMQ